MSKCSEWAVWLFLTVASPGLLAWPKFAFVATRYKPIGNHGQYSSRCMKLNRTSYSWRIPWPAAWGDAARSAKKEMGRGNYRLARLPNLGFQFTLSYIFRSGVAFCRR